MSQNIAKAFDRYTCFLLVALVTAATTVADEPAARPWIDPAGISGALLICGRPPAQAILDRAREFGAFCAGFKADPIKFKAARAEQAAAD